MIAEPSARCQAFLREGPVCWQSHLCSCPEGRGRARARVCVPYPHQELWHYFCWENLDPEADAERVLIKAQVSSWQVPRFQLDLYHPGKSGWGTQSVPEGGFADCKVRSRETIILQSQPRDIHNSLLLLGKQDTEELWAMPKFLWKTEKLLELEPNLQLPVHCVFLVCDTFCSWS